MWKTVLKRLPYKSGKFRSNPRLQEKARMEANKIMRQRHGQKFIDATEGSSISPRNSIYGKEYMALLRLIGDRGMSPAMAAKQPLVPRKAEEEEDYFFKNDFGYWLDEETDKPIRNFDYGGLKYTERKVETLRRIKKDLGEKIGLLGSFEFSKGFPKDSADDIEEVVKHLKAAFEILQDFGE